VGVFAYPSFQFITDPQHNATEEVMVALSAIHATPLEQPGSTRISDNNLFPKTKHINSQLSFCNFAIDQKLHQVFYKYLWHHRSGIIQNDGRLLLFPFHFFF
jgi:hypothetical protein